MVLWVDEKQEYARVYRFLCHQVSTRVKLDTSLDNLVLCVVPVCEPEVWSLSILGLSVVLKSPIQNACTAG